MGKNYSHILICGDFNLPNTVWSDPLPAPDCGSAQQLVDMMSMFNLTQINKCTNLRGVLLDLIFSSRSDCVVEKSIDPLLPPEAHHPPLSLELNICRIDDTKTTLFVRDFKRCDYQRISHDIQRQLGTVFYNVSPVQDTFENYLGSLRDIVTKHTPYKRIGVCHFPGWFSKELRSLIFYKKALHKRYKTYLLRSDYEEFSRVRSRCKLLTEQCHAQFITHINGTLLTNPRAFWSFVDSLKKDPSTSATSFTLDDQNSATSSETCNMFAQFFASVYQAPTSSTPAFEFNSDLKISSCKFTVHEIETKLQGLDASKGTGPDEIPPIVLKHCSSLLAPQLSIFFNECMNFGTFPNLLKTSFIVPIHKSGSKTDVKNYRPITIQPTLAKVWESLVLDKIKFQLKSVFSTQQHGFLPGKSTVSNLVLFQHHILQAFSSGKQLDCIYLDYSKAFDTVSHEHLISKLQGYGIVSPMIDWFKSYLNNRTLYVKFSGELSNPFTAVSGVPQGSLLGPFLFNLYINDIEQHLNTQCLLFADDIKIFRAISSSDDCEVLQSSLQHVENWCVSNCMRLNISKCAVVTYHRSGDFLRFPYSLQNEIICRKSTIRDLGVLLAEDLTYHEHINVTCSRASRTLGMILRTSKSGLSIQAMRTLYVSLVRPIVEYGSSIWSPYQQNQIHRIENIQVRFLRSIGLKMGFEYLTAPVNDIASMLQLDSLEKRRKMADLTFLYKIINGMVDSPDLVGLIDLHVPGHPGTRRVQLFSRRHQANNYTYHSTLPRLHRLGNIVCAQMDLFGCGLLHFKRELSTIDFTLR